MKKLKLKVEDLEERIAPTIIINGETLFSGTDLPTGDPVNGTAVSNGGPWSVENGDNDVNQGGVTPQSPIDHP